MAASIATSTGIRKFNQKDEKLNSSGAGNNPLEPRSKPSSNKVSVTGDNKLDATSKVVNPKGTGATLATTNLPPVKSDPDADYKIDRDVRSLHEAHQIRNDGQRHANAKARIKDMMAAVGRSPKVNQMAGNAGDADAVDSELPQN